MGGGQSCGCPRGELIANSGLTDDQLTDLEAVRAGPDSTGTASTTTGRRSPSPRRSRTLADHGLEPRHLRIFKTAADREAGLIEQVVAPVARQRDDDAAARADAVRAELTALDDAGCTSALVEAASKGPR